MASINFIIDFDSTFTKVEALDELCKISLDGHPDKDKALQSIIDTTNLAMEGNLSFRESLEKRLALLHAKKEHLTPLISHLKTQVSESFKKNRDFLAANADNIIIMSNGFKDFIVPVVVEYGIKPENVYANSFEFDQAGNISGFDKSNPLSDSNGKVKISNQLGLKGKIFVIGDGYNDYEIRKAGAADKFYAFTENIARANVIDKADYVAASFDEVLYDNNLTMSTSFPKSKINVLLLENIHPAAKALFETEGYQIETMSGALDEAELCEKIKDVSILGIRSKTNVTAKVLENAHRLLAIGTFCIGTNQVDLKTCAQKGIAVFNAPYSNTRSVVELAIGEIIMLMRNLPNKISAMHEGKWDKSAANSFEIRGKKLGIIGYGNIGAQLSIVAESMGMDVSYFDIIERLPLGNVTKCNTIEELLNKSDVVSLHVDGRSENARFFGKKEFDMMKDGAILLNLARGPVVEIDALVENLKSGKLRGAGIDVFPEEPKNNKEPFLSELIGLDNVILTPHIGGSTLEAQINIADFVPNKLIEYINTGNTYNSVNFPNVQLPNLEKAHRLLHVHRNESGILAKINQVLAQHDANIVGQYLKTTESIGYVITDINKAYDPELLKDLKAIDGTIKFRTLY